VDTDAKRQDHFLEGLIGPLNYQLQSHTFPNFQTLLDKAIGLGSKRKELGEQKRKFHLKGNLAATPAPATTRHRDIRPALSSSWRLSIEPAKSMYSIAVSALQSADTAPPQPTTKPLR
jgi:hypothetical protein